MTKLKCVDCGTIFESNLQECPSCGCPSNACTIEQEQPQTIQNSNANFESRSTNEERQNEFQQSPPPSYRKRKIRPFEITCYILAILFAIMWLLTQTTYGGYGNFDGANSALRKEIAAFGFLIVGRLTALINK